MTHSHIHVPVELWGLVALPNRKRMKLVTTVQTRRLGFEIGCRNRMQKLSLWRLERIRFLEPQRLPRCLRRIWVIAVIEAPYLQDLHTCMDAPAILQVNQPQTMVEFTGFASLRYNIWGIRGIPCWALKWGTKIVLKSYQKGVVWISFRHLG